MCFSGKYGNALLEEAGVPRENKHREKHANATQKGPGHMVKSGLLL